MAFPALDETNGRAVVFSNADPSHRDLRLRDVVLACAAAPSYFPAHRTESLGHRYIDGGLFANAPDLAALTIARRRWSHLDLRNIHCVSIGATRSSSGSPHGESHPGARGLYSWMMRPPARMLRLAMHGQVDHAMALMPELQRADFIRIDALIASSQGVRFDFDNASPQALRALADAGAAAIEALAPPQRIRLQMVAGRRRAGFARS